jgi:predicted RNase H-like HicB family nuclease
MAQVLDFPGAVSQGRTLRSARVMIRDALRALAACYLEQGQLLPKPNPRARAKTAVFQETIPLTVRIQTGQLGKAAAADASSRTWVCYPSRQGVSQVVCNPANGQQTVVPRHREIKPTLAAAICKQLGVPPPQEK